MDPVRRLLGIVSRWFGDGTTPASIAGRDGSYFCRWRWASQANLKSPDLFDVHPTTEIGAFLIRTEWAWCVPGDYFGILTGVITNFRSNLYHLESAWLERNFMATSTLHESPPDAICTITSEAIRQSRQGR
jgi:hypothetical protein